VTPSGNVTHDERRSRRRSRAAAMQSETALISMPQSMEIDQLSDGQYHIESNYVTAKLEFLGSRCISEFDSNRETTLLLVN
jgi:hypothetical protein